MTAQETAGNPSNKFQRKCSIAKERAFEILLTSGTYKQAAEKLNVDESTVYAWMRDPEFVSELNQLRSEVLADTLGRMKSCASLSLDVLVGALGDEQVSVRVKSAVAILELLGKFTQRQHQVASGCTLEAILDLVREKQELREVAAQS
jgi:hypothetical protein